MTKPLLFCIWNADWPRTTFSDDPLVAPGTFMGAVYRNALLDAAGMIPKGPLPKEEMEAFMAQVRALPNMQNLQDAG